MHNVSRSQWYTKQISNFLDSRRQETFILLYGREIKKVANRYPSLKITVVSCAGPNDVRKLCRLVK